MAMPSEGKPQLTVDMTADAFERLATRMRRSMFLSGFCLGGSIVGLFYLGEYTTLSVALGAGVVRVAYHGWPWEL
jgi:hypothetical protein